MKASTLLALVATATLGCAAEAGYGEDTTDASPPTYEQDPAPPTYVNTQEDPSWHKSGGGSGSGSDSDDGYGGGGGGVGHGGGQWWHKGGRFGGKKWGGGGGGNGGGPGYGDCQVCHPTPPGIPKGPKGHAWYPHTFNDDNPFKYNFHNIGNKCSSSNEVGTGEKAAGCCNKVATSDGDENDNSSGAGGILGGLLNLGGILDGVLSGGATCTLDIASSLCSSGSVGCCDVKDSGNGFSLVNIQGVCPALAL